MVFFNLQRRIARTTNELVGKRANSLTDYINQVKLETDWKTLMVNNDQAYLVISNRQNYSNEL